MNTWAISTLIRVIRDLDIYLNGRIPPADVLDSHSLSLELVHRDIIAQQALGENNIYDLDGVCELLISALSIIASLKEVEETVQNMEVHPPIHSRRFGRPRYDISFEQLSYLLENRFTIRQISDMLGVSQRTIYRRMNEFSLSVHMHYSTISDDDLDHLVCEIQEMFPMCGNVQMQGHLLARGFRVQQVRVREAQRRIDPEGCAMRSLCV